MKLLKNLIVILFAAVMLSACGDGNSPEAVVIKFQKATLDFDYETAKKYVVEDMYEDLDQLDALMSSIPKEQREMAKAASKNAEFVVKQSKISDDGNTATVTIEIKNNGVIVDESEANLVKEGGVWKIKS